MPNENLISIFIRLFELWSMDKFRYWNSRFCQNDIFNVQCQHPKLVENDYKNKTNNPIIIISNLSRIKCIQCARNQNRHIELSTHLEIIKNFFFSALLTQRDDKP